MKKWQVLYFFLGVGGISGPLYSHVRQRYFLEVRTGEGAESIVHWTMSRPLAIRMHQFSGNLDTGNGTDCATIGSYTCLDFSTARNLFAQSITQWTNVFTVGVAAQLNLDQSNGLPSPTDNNCEASQTSTDTGDAINNIIFSSKKGSSSCAYSLSSGTIGLTRIRYSVLSGEVSEADMQFDDRNYRFTTATTNNLSANPKEIVLKNVVVHELGHFFGLDHSNVRDSSMVYTVTEGLETTSNDDQMGLLALYPPENILSRVGRVEGSVMAGSVPVFGASVILLNSRTLDVNVAEMTDINGKFNVCAVSPGPQVAYATRYKPFGRNLHEYYAGNGDGVSTSDSLGCFNPGCTLMTRTLAPSFFARSTSVGADLNILGVEAGRTLSYVNIAGQGSNLNYTEPSSTHPGATLGVDQPKLFNMGSSALASSGTTAIGTHYYQFTATSADMQMRTASYKLYGRLQLKLALYQSDGSTVIVNDGTQTQGGANEKCVIYNQSLSVLATAERGIDPYIRCENLSVGSTYVLRVDGTSVPCNYFPGNASSCLVSSVEASTSNAPYYMLSLSRTSDITANSSIASYGLDGISNGMSRWANLPTCGAHSASIYDHALPHDLSLIHI